MYKTRQRSQLLEYIKSMIGTPISAADIYEHFKNTEQAIGLSTIYRYLDKLNKESLIRKYYLKDDQTAYYEYAKKTSSQDSLNFQCDICGKVEHFSCKEFFSTQEHILKDHGISLNTSKTVLRGECKDCAQKSNN